MASSTPQLPEQFAAEAAEFHVSELVSDAAGAHSPFGSTQFPLPVEQLTYVHPGADARPNLAGDL